MMMPLLEVPSSSSLSLCIVNQHLFPPFTIFLSLQLGHQPSIRLEIEQRRREGWRGGCVTSGIRSQTRLELSDIRSDAERRAREGS